MSYSSIIRGAILLSILPPTVAMLRPQTAEAATFNYTACQPDNFDKSDSPENSTPSQSRADFITGFYAYGVSTLCDRPLDDVDDFFAHTFSNLPKNIVAGTVEIRLRANLSSLSYNDTMGFGFSNPDGTLEPMGWRRYLGPAEENQGLLSSPWLDGIVQTFTFDLASLPLADGEKVDLLSTLNTKGFMDVTVQDDTAVDYISMTLTTNGDPQSVPEPISILGLLAIVPLGWKARSKCQRQPRAID